MRRHGNRDSPTHQRIDEKASKRDRHCSPRRPRLSRHDSPSSFHTSRDSDGSGGNKQASRTSSKGDFRTLCVRRFPSSLTVEALQTLLYREFNKFGDMSIGVGHLNGELAALITFKRSEDAQQAHYARPSVRFHGRSVPVEILSENPTERSESRTHRGDVPPSRDITEEFNRKTDHGVNSLRNPNMSFPGIFLPSSINSCEPSLLGLPGVVPPPSMLAAAANALGLAGSSVLTGPIPPPLCIDASSRDRVQTSRRQHDRDYDRQHSPSSDRESKATRTLFVGSLECDITEMEIQKAFQRFGLIEQIDIKRNPKAGSHAYAFVRYENVDFARRALQEMSGRRVRSIHCKIGYGKPMPSQCLYVSRRSTLAPDAFHQLVSKLSQVARCEWSRNGDVAKILFENLDGAVTAHNQFKTMLPDRLRVDFISPEAMQPNEGAAAMSGNRGNDDLMECSPLKKLCSSDVRTPGGVYLNKHTYPSAHSDSSRARDISPGSVSDKGDKFRCSGSLSQGRRSLQTEFTPTLQTVSNLSELDICLQPDIWNGSIVLKGHVFPFRCLHVIGDAEISSQLGRLPNSSSEVETGDLHPTLMIVQRGLAEPSWMAEATDRIHTLLADRQRGLSLMLVLPDIASKRICTSPLRPLAGLIAYLKLKQSFGIVVPVEKPPSTNANVAIDRDAVVKDIESAPLSVNVFAPSSFALSLLKLAAPKLTSELATVNTYMMILAVKK